MDISKFESKFDFKFPSWSSGLQDAISEWKNQTTKDCCETL